MVASRVENTEVFKKSWTKNYILQQWAIWRRNFKFYFNIYIFLNINTDETSKEQYLN